MGHMPPPCPHLTCSRTDEVVLSAPRAWLGRLSVVTRLAILLFVLLLLPLSLLLSMAETGHVDDMTRVLALFLAVGLGLLMPVSRCAARVLVLQDLEAINDFCIRIKGGRYRVRFEVGLEQSDEPELLRLKRNMNWMAHHIETQAQAMRVRLDKIGLRQQHYQQMSYRDPLTGLFNRRYMVELLDTVTRRGTADCGIYLALIDCDSFKQVNDTHGHDAGDAVLTVLGRIIGDSVRDGDDSAFRYGGDEFGVLFRDLDLSGCLAACERIRVRFEVGNSHGCTVSIGVARFTDRMRGHNAALLRASDRALYRAKDLGRNRVEHGIDDKDYDDGRPLRLSSGGGM